MAKRWQSWLTALLIVCCLSVVVAHAYVGSFNRVMADTYCYAVNARTYGLVGAQRIWYSDWTGRYSFSLAESLTGLGGPRLMPFLAPAVLLVWLIALVGAIKLFDLSSGWYRSAWVAALLG